ncbi:MAG: uracil-DNA glycosylase [Fusobacteria bacterium]|nr:uracil-DNA glycosylase [Fusobacteriota bacterium]
MKTFLEEYKIHKSYQAFFSSKRVMWIEKTLELLGDYTPSKENIFKALSRDISTAKVIILGQDPYPQKGAATGLAFQVSAASWLDKEINTSLKNILKLLYFSYENKRATIEEIRSEILLGKFLISAPHKLLDSWQRQGVILLNTALTTKVLEAGSHLSIWKEFTSDLLDYMAHKNQNLEFFLWGNKVAPFKKSLKFGKISESNHPAICGNLENPKDFLNNFCFIESQTKIEWLK